MGRRMEAERRRNCLGQWAIRIVLLGGGVSMALGLAGCGASGGSGSAAASGGVSSVVSSDPALAGASAGTEVRTVKGWEPIPGSNGNGAAGNDTGNGNHGGDVISGDSTEDAAGDTYGGYTDPEHAGAGDGQTDADGSGTAVSGDTEDLAESGDTADADGSEEGSAEAGKADTSGVETSLVKSSSAELAGLMNAFMAENGLNSGNFAVAYENLQTGETYYFNELKQWDAASTYKFPLNLLYYDMQAAGEITGDTIIPGTNTPLSECHHQSLEYSNNPLSEAMMDNLGSYDQVKQRMRKYFTLTDAETDNSYYHHNYFCARQMMDCSKYLYDHQSQYQEALGYLEAAQPGMYFRKNISGVTIAQKYGQRDGYEHTAGIVFGKVPFVLSVYSYNAGSEPMIGSCAKLFYDYTE